VGPPTSSWGNDRRWLLLGFLESLQVQSTARKQVTARWRERKNRVALNISPSFAPGGGPHCWGPRDGPAVAGVDQPARRFSALPPSLRGRGQAFLVGKKSILPGHFRGRSLGNPSGLILRGPSSPENTKKNLPENSRPIINQNPGTPPRGGILDLSSNRNRFGNHSGNWKMIPVPPAGDYFAGAGFPRFMLAGLTSVEVQRNSRSKRVNGKASPPAGPFAGKGNWALEAPVTKRPCFQGHWTAMRRGPSRKNSIGKEVEAAGPTQGKAIPGKNRFQLKPIDLRPCKQIRRSKSLGGPAFPGAASPQLGNPAHRKKVLGGW